MTLQIGRVGLDVTLDDPEQLAEQAGDRRQLTVTGTLLAATLAETKALRDELAAMVDLGGLVPVTWTGDPNIDG
jgi:hypothetical protein